MFRSSTLLIFLLLAASWQVANADDEMDVVETKLRTLAPSATTIAISETPVEGLLQAQINSDIVYISADGQYLVQGTLFDIDARVNLTDQAKSDVRRVVLGDIDNPREILFSPQEEPVHSLLVFTDIDCGYCRKLHEQIDEYMEKGIEIKYMAYPRAGIGSPSYEKFVSVWCADDQKAALTAAKAGIDPEPKQCENPILEQFELGQQLGVTGTPALITSDGTLIPGYMQPEMLRARLDTLEEQKIAAAP